MATNSDEFLLKLKSNISDVTGRDAASLQALVARAQVAMQNLAKLDVARAKLAAAGATQAQVVQKAAAALQKASASGDGDAKATRAAQSKLAVEQRRLNSIRSAEKALAASAKAERAHIDALQRGATVTGASAVAAKKAGAGADKASASMQKLSEGASALGGPLSSLSGQLSQLAPLAELSAGSFIMLGASALAVVLVAGAMAAYAALIKFAFAAASARREAVLLGGALEGVTQRGGDEFNAVVDQLARRVPLAKEKLQEMAKEMALLKLGGRDLQAGLTATAIVTSALGDAAGRGVRGIVEQSKAIKRFTLGARDMYGEYAALAGTGLTRADLLGALAKQLGKSLPEVERMLYRGRVKLKDGLRALESAAKGRFGKTISGQLLSFDTQISKAKESLSSLVDGVNIEPALVGLKAFLSMFDEGTVTGKAVKLVLTSTLNAVARGFEIAGPIAKEFFLGMAIAALKVYIALKPLYNSVRDFFGFKPGDGIEKALTAGKVAFYAIATAAVVVGASVLLALSPLIILGGLLYASFVLVAGAFSRVSNYVKALSTAFADAYDEILSIDFGQLGTSIIEAIVNALKSGAGQVFESIKSLGSDMLKKFKESIQSASPSKLFFRAGLAIPQGVGGGVESGTPEVHDAIEGLGRARPAGAAGGPEGVAAASGTGHGASVSVTFNGPVSIGGAPGDREALADFLVRRVTEQLFGSPAEAGT